MLSSRTQQKAEAKYNVTTDFPRLDLHSASASGNLGLVKFALSHGQPINSVLDGVLPLHAACAGGSAVVVEHLINEGADVNAPRLPRRYSNEKNRNATGLIVGTSGSTPLHFAAANGHADVIRMLLEHGALPDRSDKHGITSEMLAHDNGWVECVEVIRDWRIEHEVDYLPTRTNDRDASAEPGDVGHSRYPSGSKRLQVKRSIDNALQLFKSTPGQSLYHNHHHLPPSPTSATFTADPPSPAGKPLGEYTFYPITDSPDQELEAPPRRPSLPHLYNTPDSPFQSQSRMPGRSCRRPRSAGNGAEQGTGETDSADRGTPKLTSKYSLLSLFKRANGEAIDTPLPPSPPPTSSVFKFAVRSPACSWERSTSPDEGSSIPSTTTPPPASNPSPNWYRSRLGSEVSVRSPLATTAVELHHDHALSTERLIERSESQFSSGVFESEEDTVSASALPSILRHNRSSSSQSTSLTPSGGRTLRFDSASSHGSASNSTSNVNLLGRNGREQSSRIDNHSPGRRLRGCTSVGSLRSREELVAVDEVEVGSSTDHGVPEPAPQLARFEDGNDSENMQGTTDAAQSPNWPIPIQGRSRGRSFASSSSSLSPALSPGDVTTSTAAAAEFPFSIDKPPPTTAALAESPGKLGVPRQVSHTKASESRLRGESFSSMDTDTSANALLSQSSSTSGTNMTTPPLSSSATHVLPTMKSGKIPIYTHHEHESPTSSLEDLDLTSSMSFTSLDAGSGRMPVDLRSVSNRAEAEALVQRAQKEILDLANVPNEEQHTPGLNRMPLSAQLAAYGEMLALERRFAKGEKQREQWATRSESDEELDPPATHSQSPPFAQDGPYGSSGGRKKPGFKQVASFDRTVSSPSKITSNLVRSTRQSPKVPKVKRPHTAEGGNSREWDSTSRSDTSPAPESTRPTHGQSRSASSPVHIDLDIAKGDIPASIKIIETTPPPVDPPIPSHLRSHAHTSNPSLRPIPTPSHTPDPVSEKNPPLGPPLTRISTAPLQDTCNDLLPNKNSRSRQMASALKLARMGFSMGEVGQLPPVTTTSSTRSASKQRFGSIKSLMQSLKGKT